MEEGHFYPIVHSVWARAVGRDEQTPTAQYILESVVADLTTNGAPETVEASIERFEETLSNFEQADADDCREFCEILFEVLKGENEQEAQGEDEDGACLQPGECEMCERYMPLTRHHLMPRMMHARLRKQGFERDVLCRTCNICRLCHDAVHRFFSEKELALEYNTVEKLMQVGLLGFPFCEI